MKELSAQSVKDFSHTFFFLEMMETENLREEVID